MKKVYITNGVAANGKDSFAKALGEYISVYKYSSIDLVKEMLETVGVSREPKTEEKRKLYSDTKDMLTKYDDIPFKDVKSVVSNFANGRIDADVLLIDIREPEEIARAVKEFDAKTILIRNPNVSKITSNHADANVENYNYDYIIENNGNLEQLDNMAKLFVENIVNVSNKYHSKPIVFDCKKGCKEELCG